MARGSWGGWAPPVPCRRRSGVANDLLPLGRTVAPDAALLSARGKVLEHGMPRFFRRLAEGVFDEDVRHDASALADFSNGANIGAVPHAPSSVDGVNSAPLAGARQRAGSARTGLPREMDRR
jgi:phospholipase/carboxylesterase